MYSADRLAFGCIDAMLVLERLRLDEKTSHAPLLSLALLLAEYNEQNRFLHGFWLNKSEGVSYGVRAYYRRPGLAYMRTDRIMRSLAQRLARLAREYEAIPVRMRGRTLALLLMLHKGLISEMQETSLRRRVA